MTHELWSTLNRKMYEYLTSVTLFDLVDKQLRKAGGERAVIAGARPAGSSLRGKTLAAIA